MSWRNSRERSGALWVLLMSIWPDILAYLRRHRLFPHRKMCWIHRSSFSPMKRKYERKFLRATLHLVPFNERVVHGALTLQKMYAGRYSFLDYFFSSFFLVELVRIFLDWGKRIAFTWRQKPHHFPVLLQFRSNKLKSVIEIMIF